MIQFSTQYFKITLTIIIAAINSGLIVIKIALEIKKMFYKPVKLIEPTEIRDTHESLTD